jgi:cation diffusion facilitator CzcD-associated flavoprotein CzcO
MYRFHPSVKWQDGYPNRQQIVSQITELWKKYGLEERTKFDTPVEKICKDDKGRWIINNPSNGRFDGIIAAIGTCGDPKMPHIPGQEKFKGEIYHSSQLTGKDVKGKKIIIIGGGASAVEALEFAAVEEAAKTYILARSDKWIIPRNAVVDMLFAFNIFGQETILSWIPEMLLRKFFYRDLEDLAPTDKGIFTGTPMVNSDVLEKIRSGKAEWLRGDIKTFTERGILLNHRAKGVPAGGPGREELIEGDIAIMATGFHRPSLNFLPQDTFKEPYYPPNWYLQTFPPNHP